MESYKDAATTYMLLCDHSRNAERIKKDLLPLAEKGAKFIEGPKRERTDSLGGNAFTTGRFYKQNDRFPSAEKLWDLMPVGDFVQEKEEDADKTIYWRSKDKDKKTNFRSFQDRMTHIKTKIQNKKSGCSIKPDPRFLIAAQP